MHFLPIQHIPVTLGEGPLFCLTTREDMIDVPSVVDFLNYGTVVAGSSVTSGPQLVPRSNVTLGQLLVLRTVVLHLDSS